MRLPLLLALLSSLAILAHGDILERFIAPMEKKAFQTALQEQHWAYFPHNESTVPITLDHVAEWFGGTDGTIASEALEALPHPFTGRDFEERPKSTGLERAQDAFLKGHSMVINSLHKWSEPAMRLARDLYDAVDLPIDVYMYLTPPHSHSYGLHSDVMDAWMVQVTGAKTWKLCEKRIFQMGAQVKEGPATGECQVITMRGGDVLYLPFCTMHQADTHAELSAHLTVNVERQYYVWATLLLAVLHKAMQPRLRVDNFVMNGDFRMEGETELELFLLGLMAEVPRLARIPAGEQEPTQASRWLTRSLSRDDLPAGYFASVLDEYRSTVAELAQVVSDGHWKRKEVEVGGRRLSGPKLVELLAKEESEQALPWVLELVRLHTVMHFIRDNPKRVSPPPETFSSLAALRSDAQSAARLDKGSSMGDLLSESTQLVRRPDVRAVLLLEDLADASDFSPLRLQVGSKQMTFKAHRAEVLHYCLGLFGDTASRGRPFLAGSVPGSFSEAQKVIKKLVLAGVLRILPAQGAE